MSDNHISPLRYGVLRLLNKPIFVMGLLPLHLIVSILVIGFSFFIIKFFCFLLIVPFILVARKLAIEHSRGNPDYVDTFMTEQFTNPKVLTDESGLLKYLIKK